ncbi:MAG: VanW family protein [Actinobacteria bacterium]|nr:VanW family protein [Actinomycetota bacterium]
MLAADSAQKLLVNSFPTSSDPLVLRFASVNPSVSDAQAQEFISTAKSAVVSPITVTVGKKEGTIKPADLAKAPTSVGADGEFAPPLAGAVLVNSLKSQIHGIGNTAVDASFKIFNGKPYVVPGKNGTGINPDKIAQAVLQVIDQAAPRVVDLQLAQTKPDFTDADAKALGITEKLSSFTQNFPYAAYRVQNIGTAARYLDGKIIKPGQVFSMNDTVHERTVANGYTVGYIVGQGGQLLKDLGGGVSTATTAVWSAAFYANMQRVEQRAHSIWIPRYTAGLEATVSWGSLDLKWRNTSKHGVLIKSYITDHSVTVTLYGTKEFDQVKAEFSPRRNTTQYGTIHSTIDGCEYQGGQNGFDITVTRVVTIEGRVVKREPFNTHYSPEPVVICGKPAAPVASPSASYS